MRAVFLLASLLALSSCSSPPKPPGVDESRRHPLNSAAEVGLQQCKAELQSARILVSETTRDADALRTSLMAITAARRTAQPSIQDVRGVTYTVLFPYGAATVALNPSEADALFAQAKTAPLIMLRGRTDGDVETRAEGRIARERAEFIRETLVRMGVPANRIRTTWQPVGDHAADNDTPSGRALNRRVEIELYRAAPRVARFEPTAES